MKLSLEIESREVQPYFIIDCKEFNVYGVGDNMDMAAKDLCQNLKHFSRYYADIPNSKLTEFALQEKLKWLDYMDMINRLIRGYEGASKRTT